MNTIKKDIWYNYLKNEVNFWTFEGRDKNLKINFPEEKIFLIAKSISYSGNFTNCNFNEFIHFTMTRKNDDNSQIFSESEFEFGILTGYTIDGTINKKYILDNIKSAIIQKATHTGKCTYSIKANLKKETNGILYN